MTTAIYLDNNATTQVDPRVLEEMLPYLQHHFGNPSSRHVFGKIAEEAVEVARARVASLAGCDSSEIFFTSGATESNNLALKGIAWASGKPGGHIISAATEHKAILDPLKALEEQGYQVTLLPVDPDGLLDPEQVLHSIRADTVLVSIMPANNETGVLQNVADMARLCHERGVPLHTDAAQALGKIRFDASEHEADLASFSAHKVYGPKGVGALMVRRRRPRLRLNSIIEGGGHESGLRSGTLNVAGIVGFGRACELAREELDHERCRILGLRERLQGALLEDLPDTKFNGSMTRRLPGNLNVTFRGIEGESLLIGLHDVAISSTSACTSGLREPSHVLKAMGLTDEDAYASVRFGIGRFNTEEEVDTAARRVVEVVRRLRAMG